MYIHHLRKFPPNLCDLFILISQPLPQAITELFSVLYIDLYFLEIYIHGLIEYVPFWVWLLSSA